MQPFSETNIFQPERLHTLILQSDKDIFSFTYLRFFVFLLPYFAANSKLTIWQLFTIKNINPLGTVHHVPTSKFLNIKFGKGFFLEID